MDENPINLAKTAADAAVLLFRLGFTPIKVVGKNPAFGEGTGWQQTHFTSENEVREHFKEWNGQQLVPDDKDKKKLIPRHRNVGVLCDGMVMFGHNSQETYDAFKAECPFYDDTLQRAGNNPFPCAIFKRADHETKFWSGQKILTNEESPRTMMDIWGNSNQFVAFGVHPTGTKYQFLNTKEILPMKTADIIELVERVMLRMGNGYRLKTKIKEEEGTLPKTFKQDYDLFSEVKRRVRIKDLLGTTETRIKCPLHTQGSSNPSAVIYENADGDSVYCHSVGCYADAISLYARQNGFAGEKYAQLRAAKELAQKYGIEILQAKEASPTNNTQGYYELSEVFKHVGEKIGVRCRISGYHTVVDAETSQPAQQLILESLDYSTQIFGVLPDAYTEPPSGIVKLIGRAWIPKKTDEEEENKKQKKKEKKYVNVTFFIEKIEDAHGDLTAPLDEHTLVRAHDLRDKILNYATLIEHYDKIVAPNIIGRGFEKTTALAVAASPIYTPLSNKTFALKVLFGGREREGKDKICEDVGNLSPECINVNSEMASTAGLSGGVVSDKHLNANVIKWGALVQANRKLAHLRGVSSFPPERQAELRENLSSGKIRINKIKSGEREALSRLLMTGNSNKRSESYPTLYDMVRDVGSNSFATFPHPADFKRVHLPIPISGHATLTEKFTAQFFEATEDNEDRKIIRRLLARAWGATPEQWNWNMEALKRYSKNLAGYSEKFRGVDLAFFDSEGVYILAALAGGFAVISGSVDAEKIYVEEKHIGWAYQFVAELVERLEVGKILERLDLQDEAVASIVDAALDVMKMQEMPIWDSYAADHDPEYETKNAFRQQLWKFKKPVEDVIYAIVMIYGTRRMLTWSEIAEMLTIPERTLYSHLTIFGKFIDFVTFHDYGAIPNFFDARPRIGVSLSEMGVKMAKKLILAITAEKTNVISCSIAALAGDYIYILNVFRSRWKKMEEDVNIEIREKTAPFPQYCNTAGSDVQKNCSNGAFQPKTQKIEFLKPCEQVRSLANPNLIIGGFKYGDVVVLPKIDADWFVKNGFAEMFKTQQNI